MAATYLPTLKQLQYLVALRDHGHFGRAAEACFRQPVDAVGGHPRTGGADRRGRWSNAPRRVVRFTALGERITDKARRVLREADELADLARAAGEPLSGDDADERDPDDRAVHAAPHPAGAAPRLSRPETLSARGTERPPACEGC